MSIEINWTPGAKNNLDSIKTYLSEEWSDSISKSFESKVKDFTEIIREFPNLGSVKNNSKGIRGFQIVKTELELSSLLYLIQGKILKRNLDRCTASACSNLSGHPNGRHAWTLPSDLLALV